LSSSGGVGVALLRLPGRAFFFGLIPVWFALPIGAPVEGLSETTEDEAGAL
jgi:hypothetical protein